MAKHLKLVLVLLMVLILPAMLRDNRYKYSESAPAIAEVTAEPTAYQNPTDSSQTPAPTPDPHPLALSAGFYEKGIELMSQGSYGPAIVYFSSVCPDDIANYSSSRVKIYECRGKIKAAFLEKAWESYNKAHYNECMDIVASALLSVPGDKDLADLSDQAQEAVDNPVLYDGPVYHIFFHSLIVYPELCFTGDSMSDGYNKWMVTAVEFKKILDGLYNRGYVLIDISEMFSPDQTGKMQKKPLYLPKGQKPLVLSVDNVSYEDYRMQDGFASQLLIDPNGDVATLVKTPGGNSIVSRDGDVMPILDDFVQDRPDFSHGNAKGIIALDGYTGILGYRTNHSNPDWENQKTEALKVVERLKETGWKFACHSYSHTRKFSDRSISLDELKKDTAKWENEVGDITGPTSIYVTPFGVEFDPGDPRQQYLASQGFNIFCGVGYRAYYALHQGYVYMERIDIDGYKMNFSPKILEPLMDIKMVYDTGRPVMKK